MSPFEMAQLEAAMEEPVVMRAASQAEAEGEGFYRTDNKLGFSDTAGTAALAAGVTEATIDEGRSRSRAGLAAAAAAREVSDTRQEELADLAAAEEETGSNTHPSRTQKAASAALTAMAETGA